MRQKLTRDKQKTLARLHSASSLNRSQCFTAEGGGSLFTPTGASSFEVTDNLNGHINGINAVLSTISGEVKLEKVKVGEIPAADVDKFNLQRTGDGGWEIADAPPLPAKSVSPPAQNK